MSPAPWGWLGAFLALLVAQRLSELVLSARNARRELARGAVESGRGHFWIFVLLHVLFPLAMIAEVGWGGARPPAWWPWALVVFAAGQALRYAAIAALGPRWNVRILAVPGEPPVTRGIYRRLRHPNYLGVALELAAGPLLFGAWRTALGALALHLVAMAVRVPAEERALGLRPRSGRRSPRD